MLSYVIPSDDPHHSKLQLNLNGDTMAASQIHSNGVTKRDGDSVVNGHSSTTTVVVNADGSSVTTTTTFSSSNCNPPASASALASALASSPAPGGAANGVHKKIIKTTSLKSEPVANGASAASAMSTESSVSSLSTVASEAASGQAATPTGDKPKPKLLANGTKHAGLKRVSFGSSKGSMVETLIYESPLHEEPEVQTPTSEAPSSALHPATRPSTAHPLAALPTGHPALLGAANASLDPSAEAANKVRVSFFESSKPQQVPADAADFAPEDLDVPVMATDGVSPGYLRQTSTDSGWDNPFRPDGDLSREADEIVELIKGGKPITGVGRPSSANGPTDSTDAPTSPNRANNANSHESPVLLATSAPLSSSTPQPQPQPQKNGANGKSHIGKEKAAGSVDIQRNTLAAGEASQVEHVTLKKKPRCTCCIIQ